MNMKKTTIYKTYADFLSREDKTENGVSESFANDNPAWEQMNETNDGCWNCSDCSYCRYCRSCSSCRYCSSCSSCSDCSYCRYCRYCRYCSSCSDCSDCSSCSDCSDCSYCSSWKNGEPIDNIDIAISDNKAFIVPKIENIHEKVLEAVTPPEHTLNMSTWHTCGTTHCRAGWVVHLAGEAGYLLEKQTSTAFAAMQIYKESSPIHVGPNKFYDSNEVAFADIEKCAEEERGLKS